MVFNSLEFAIFLPVVFGLYWFLFNKNLKWQNLLLLAASYFFYGWWDWRFLALILFTSLVDFTVARRLDSITDSTQRKAFLAVAISVNLVVLGFFKYFNFFAISLQSLAATFGVEVGYAMLHIVLPVGISFYTFQSMGYAIDVYRKDIKACDDLVSFLTFVGFFPHMVAGPIMRAKNLLPQFYKIRQFDYSQAVSGMQLILFGLFKKVVVADNLAKLADHVFNNGGQQSGIVVFAGVLAFAFQIYGDFSGYSDMASGIARLFGFDLMQNFKTPYFSASIREFWQRWHIALSTWFRDYVYIPLGGNRVTEWRKYTNLMITFLVSGLWHGANYTFLIWGALHGGMLCVEEFFQQRIEIRLPVFIRRLIIFCLVCMAWIFFRASSTKEAFQMFSSLSSGWSFHYLTETLLTVYHSGILALLIGLSVGLLFMLDSFIDKRSPDVWFSDTGEVARPVLYYLIFLMIVFLGLNDSAPEFIYFKF